MSSLKWKYHKPIFESDNENYEMMRYSPWSGHRRFVYDMIVAEKPKCIVELGSYYGCSAFTFLQAIKDNDFDTKFYAIDTWAGDSFTENDYKEDIFSQYKNIQAKCFSNQNAVMMKTTFDEALINFDDESIDILHIDGSHLYDDVKHDFCNWVSKVKETGMILFHDVSNDRLNGEYMGSHLFWNEIKEEYSYTMEFPYSFGLGILLFSEQKYSAYQEACNYSYYLELEYQEAVKNKDCIRKQYFELRDKNFCISNMKEQIDICQKHLSDYEHNTELKEQYIDELEQKNQKLTSEYIVVCDDLERVQKELTDKITYLESDNKKIREYVEHLEKDVSEYHNLIQKMMDDMNGLTKYTEDKEQYIQELQMTIDKYEENISGKENYIQELRLTINKYEENVMGKENYIQELRQTIDKYEENVIGKENYIQELLQLQKKNENVINELNEELRHMKESIMKIPMGRYLLKRTEREVVETK